MKKTILLIILILVIGGMFMFIRNITSNSQDAEVTEKNTVNNVQEENDTFNATITINIDEVTMSVTLEDNATSRALLEMLPLEISMEELNGNEKYYYLSESLPTNATNVSNIEKGDIMLYGDNCLVIFYESFSTSYSYTRIGKIDDPTLLDNIDAGTVQVSISN